MAPRDGVIETSVEFASTPRDVYSVSRLNREARAVLEATFPPLWIEGEVSNLARPGSGHIYFSLKDDAAQVRCAMFRMHNRNLAFRPHDGVQVLAQARVSLYRERGEFQLIVEYMEEAGAGALRRGFERLKAKLEGEGLFDPARKREAPAFPRRIGVITSPTGAALRDVLTVLERRYRALEVLIYPTLVQGEEAPGQIVRMLDMAGRRAECDVLLLVRGGGSIEDLQPFNEEVTARAIHACPIPIVTGIGHETDFTIADFVADHRAATPSAAAEQVSPDQDHLEAERARLASRLATGLRRRLEERRQLFTQIARRLRHPRLRLANTAQRADELRLRLATAMREALRGRATRLGSLAIRLERGNPTHRLRAGRAVSDQLRRRLITGGRNRLEEKQARVASLLRALHAVGPESTLKRGYAVVTTHPGGDVLRAARATAAGEQVIARLAEGSLRCRVDEVQDG